MEELLPVTDTGQGMWRGAITAAEQETFEMPE